MKGLSCAPEDRWPTAREYARAIDRALPEVFDDQQVAELMGRLFDDKIAVTRSMLSSSQATVADLQLISRRGDSDTHASPIVTTPARPALAVELTEKNLDPVQVHSFVSPRMLQTPGWVYVVAALTAVAGLLMLTMLVLILVGPAPRPA